MLRTGGAPVTLGLVLLVISVSLGTSLAAVLGGFPLPILAGLLAVAGVLHIALLKDLREPSHWLFAISVGVVGFLSNLAVAMIAALLFWWAANAIFALRDRRTSMTGVQR